MIYLDNNSTTQIDPEVLDEMMPYLNEEYGNPGTQYSLGRKAAKAIDTARQRVADFICAKPEQIIFTSGGTESNNMVFVSTRDYLTMLGKKSIVSDLTEHDSVLRSIDELCMKHGFRSSYLDIDANGCVNVSNFENYIRKDTGIASIMYMNNETGAENDIYLVGKKCSEHGILFHTDCVQAAGCCGIDVVKIGCDFLSLSSHKIHGTKGTGALYVRNSSIISPMIIGGATQEFGFRGGTENVAGIVGFGKACEIMNRDIAEIDKHTSVLKQMFYNAVKDSLTGVGLQGIMHVNGDIIKHGKTLNLTFDGVDGETLLLMLDAKGICLSSGSACRSHVSEPSHVLIAMGVNALSARNSIRVSFSKMNTIDEVIAAADVTAELVKILHSGDV